MDAVHQVGIVVGGRAIHTQADADLAGIHARNVGDFRPDQIDRFGAMGDAGPGGGQPVELPVGQFPAMGVEDVRPDKTHVLAIIHRAPAVRACITALSPSPTWLCR